MSTTLQQHKDEFSQFIWKRRVQSKKEMRSLFSSTSGMMCRLGDVISSNTTEAIAQFEQSNAVRLTRDVVKWTLCEAEDLPGYLGKKMILMSPRVQPHSINLKHNRLEFHLDNSTPPLTWGCIYGNCGPSSEYLPGKRMLTDMTGQSLEHLLLTTDPLSTTHTSFHCTLAKLIDAIHPSHGLQVLVLAYPLYAGTILKRRLVQLGYSISPFTEETGIIDATFTKNILKQLYHGLVHDQRFYFEISYPDNTVFRFGVVSSKHAEENNHKAYPGYNEYSFGFGSGGEIWFKGESYEYTTFPPVNPLFVAVRTLGLVVDFYSGNICLVYEKQILDIAFGRGATHFSAADQEKQRFVSQVKENEYAGNPEVQLNFGRTTFMNSADARSFDALLYLKDKVDTSESRDNKAQEEEEKMQLAAEKNTFRTTLFTDVPKSFSQFPPSIYRRSLACTKIQRVWRRFRGRRERRKLRERQYEAATIIQRVARRKLRHLRSKKHDAAVLIQKNWRKLCFIWIALLRCIYQTPIVELHRAASCIQKAWRKWFMFRNSPIAARYNAKLEDIEAAVNKIISWWRPLHAKANEKKKINKKHMAATTIQRIWRGYVLRHILRDDLRVKLTNIGQKIAQHRGELLRIRAAYILQNAWRNFIQKRIRIEKIKTRHSAAARIQAFWKGYWVRSHVHLRFSYGEAVFLIAVCKAFRNCHFILKMYRPCGIVCPKSTN
ncbi:hypothetical protein BCR33DRAFT_754541 [Rhizoclosmatium globosum]|uniref:SPRY domain-containing protein n=1 Tax=Rhizoclosmatium globosum TaxID=329046 RepID=A0A1Y2BV60_9FUNG|nr:hypothetical protein BCR33DRAFT_754541 [Rhizoclosmatium globosum]|eukprot:ORY38662.1 hypothetical protein BCR33DRAFT_754541 [Rhizoclosmatium globosum]